MLLDREETLLFLVDFQDKLRPSMHEGEETVRRAHILAQAAQALDVPVMASEQNPDKLGSTVLELSPYIDQTFSKERFSAAEEEAFSTHFTLGNALSLDRATVLLCGWESHVCVLQTALELKEKGQSPVIVEDAVTSRHPDSKATALRRFAHHGIEVVNTEMVIFEWLRTYTDPQFRELSKLIR